jgi:hypothetical protein
MVVDRSGQAPRLTVAALGGVASTAPRTAARIDDDDAAPAQDVEMPVLSPVISGNRSPSSPAVIGGRQRGMTRIRTGCRIRSALF